MCCYRNAYLDTRTIMEPAGILSLAGAEKFVKANNIKNKNIITICSGANMDFDRLRFISENYDITEKLLYTQIPEKPGSFIDLYKCIYPLTYLNLVIDIVIKNMLKSYFQLKVQKINYLICIVNYGKKNFNYKILKMIIFLKYI